MRRESKKHRTEREATSPHRAAYVAGANLRGGCELCQERQATDCHEITAGSSRQRAIHQPNAWLALCRECHEEIQGSDIDTQTRLKCSAVVRTVSHCLGRSLLLEDHQPTE